MICRLPERPGMIPCHVRSRTSVELSWHVWAIRACAVAPPAGGVTAVAAEGLGPLVVAESGEPGADPAVMVDDVPADEPAPARVMIDPSIARRRLTNPPPSDTAAANRRRRSGRRPRTPRRRRSP